MPPLPVISGEKAIAAFKRDGWVFDSQRGSHIKLIKNGTSVKLIIPNHKTLDKGTLRSLIKKSGLTVDEFISLL